MIVTKNYTTPFCLLAGGSEGVPIGDFCALAYRVSLFSQMVDYHGLSMVNSTISAESMPETIKVSVHCQSRHDLGRLIFTTRHRTGHKNSNRSNKSSCKVNRPPGPLYAIPAMWRKVGSIKIIVNPGIISSQQSQSRSHLI